MPIYLDDELIESDIAAADLDGLLEWASKRLESDGRMIVEVKLDGESLVGESLEEKRSTGIDAAEVRLVSADRRELVIATLEQVRERFEQARGEQAEAAQLIQQDKMTDALKLVSSVIEAWQQTQTAVLHSARLMSIDLDAVEGEDGQTLSELAMRLIDQLKAMRALLEVGDTVGVADELAYEWPATIDRWDGMIGRLIETVKSQG